MKLYYTSPVGQDQIQTDPRLSLGGYRALSSVPSDAFDNLFSEISQFMLSKTIENEYIGLIFKNESGAKVDALWLWFEYPTECYSKYLVAAVDLTADTNNVLKMEHISTRNSKPLYAEFYEANGIDNAVNLGSVEDEGMIGLWISRQLIENLATIVQSETNIYENDPINVNLVSAKIPIKLDNIIIHFDWGSYYGGAIGSELVFTDYFITQNLTTIFRGDTYLGAEFSLAEDSDPDIPLNLTDAKIELTTNSEYGLSTEDGTILITDEINGVFAIPEQIINWPAATYHFKIKVTFASSRVRTYVVGIWEILR